MCLAKHILNNIGTAQEATQSLFASGELEGIYIHPVRQICSNI